MATRVEIHKKKTALVSDLRAAFNSGVWREGEIAVSQRELSLKYELSMRTVGLELQKLVAEGILYAVPRVGTFVGRPVQVNPNCYLFVKPYDGPEENHVHLLRVGFEDRIAALGGSTLSLSPAAFAQHQQSGQLPPLAGIFERTHTLSFSATEVSLRQEMAVPRVRFGHSFDEAAAASNDLRTMDVVDFDNVASGSQAARHLLSMGYRRIGFIGLHDLATQPFGPDAMHWSAERALGYTELLSRSVPSHPPVLFLPSAAAAPEHKSQETAAREAVALALSAGNLDAIISVNMFVGEALIAALQSRPSSSWPAIVSFDDYQPADSHIMSCFHLPWSAIGATAADLLWERGHGQLTGPPVVRTVPLRLVRRLTCRPDWGGKYQHSAPEMAA